MKINSIKNIRLYNYKNYKINYKFKSIINCLENQHFILFYYKNTLKSSEEYDLKKNLEENNLSSIIIKKNILNIYLSNNKYDTLKNLLNDKIILIYNKENEIINKKTFNILQKNSKLILVGGLWNKKFYRTFDIKKLINLNAFNTKIKPLVILNSHLNKLKFSLSFLKKKV